MKKNGYESPQISIFMLEEENVITSSLNPGDTDIGFEDDMDIGS